MSHRDRRHAQAAGARHRWLNRLQTALLVLTLLGIAAVAGSLLLGDSALWLALAAAGFTLLIQRLRELADSMAPQPLHSGPFLPDIPLAPRPPRWRASGVWR